VSDSSAIDAAVDDGADAGVGLLAYPFGVAATGWSGFAVLALLALLCRYTASLLGTITREFPQAREFASMAHLAFGLAGTIIMAITFMFELLISGAASFIVLASDTLNALIPTDDLGPTSFAFIFVLAVTPTLLIPDISYVSFVTIPGVTSSVSVLVAVLYAGIANSGQPIGGIVPSAPTSIFIPQGVPFVLGLFQVGFSGHACFPAIRDAMANPDEYESALNWAFVIALSVYSGLSAVGYLMYGAGLESAITLNLPPGTVITQIAMWLILTTVWSKLVMAVEPVADVAEGGIVAIVERLGGKGAADCLFGPEQDYTKHDHDVDIEMTRLPRTEDASEDAKGDVDSSLPPLDLPPASRGDRLSTGSGASTLSRGRELSGDSVRRAHSALDDPASAFTGVAHWHDDDDDDDAHDSSPRKAASLPSKLASYVLSKERAASLDAREHESKTLVASKASCCERECMCKVTWRRWISRSALRLLLVGFALGIALGVPQFETILALAGSIPSFAVSVTAPPALYAILFRERLSWRSWIFHWAMTAFGMVCTIVGTVGAIMGPKLDG
jgi:hypothetical protein